MRRLSRQERVAAGRALRFEGQLAGVSYSADGKLVLVFGDWGTKVYDAASGSLVHSFVDKTVGDGTGTTVFHSAVAGELFVCTGNPGTAFAKDLSSGENLQALDRSTHTGSSHPITLYLLTATCSLVPQGRHRYHGYSLGS